MMSEWFVARTKTHAEGSAVWHLRNQGFEAYVPRYRKQIRHARKTEVVLRPLFPGYVFVGIDIEHQRWRSVNGTMGVISLVQFGEGPQPIHPSIIDAIRSREDADGTVSLAPKGLKKGDLVRVCEGTFADHTALLEEVSDNKRVVLLLDLMGRAVRVSAPLENLARAS